MTTVFLRPDLKTAGGEISDIIVNGMYAGSLTLVFREYDRVSGAIQLDQPSLPSVDKEFVLEHINKYVQAFTYSVEATECTVSITYSALEGMIDLQAIDADDEEQDEEIYYDEMELEEIETLDMGKNEYQLVIVGEGSSKVEYHIYDEDEEWIAEAMIFIDGDEVQGDVHWQLEPDEDEIEALTELLVSDYDEDVIDTFLIHHHFDNEFIETIELTHLELLEDQSESLQSQQEEDYTVVLSRDDGDMLTYEIYQKSQGGLPVGTATIDITHRVLTGFIDFRDPYSTDYLDTIATLLMRELDKEKEYKGINLTVLYHNKPIDEMIIECEPLH
jgi:hypothetical protein